MESIYHIVAIRVNETSWTHVWRLRSRYLGTGFDNKATKKMKIVALRVIGQRKVYNFFGFFGGVWYKDKK
jgi:hypothetical protein